MTRVKICGLTNAADALAAAAAGADFLGFVFAPGPRRVDPAEAAGFWPDLPLGPAKVAVFRDQPLEEVERTIELLGPDLLQFHGAEPPGFCRIFGLPLIRALPALVPADLAIAGAYAGLATYYLVDLPKGCGADALPAEVARAATRLPLPSLLAGGLTPENVRWYVEQFRPFGVDAARGVESAPGVKDHGKLRAFLRAVKS